MLQGKTIFITGSSRGIGREMALRFAKEGANIVVIGKTADPHPKLPGTIHSVAQEVIDLGGKALPLQVDLRDDAQIEQAIQRTVAEFGGIDILINNASAIFLAPCAQTPMKRFDLIMQVNTRSTFACSHYCLPYLRKSSNPHILNLSPPLNMDKKWFKDHTAYTISKYGMSMCTLGLAEEFAAEGIAVNSLWPKTTIATAAIEYNFPAQVLAASRKPSIVADAAYLVVTKASKSYTGHFVIDEDILRASGVKDFNPYAMTPNVALFPDLFL